MKVRTGAAASALVVVIVSLALASLGSLVRAQPVPKLLPKAELKQLIRTASTADDHRRLAAHYLALVERYESERREHDEMRAAYEKDPLRYPSKHPTMGDHCRSLAWAAAESANKARKLADMHLDLARTAEKQQPDQKTPAK